MTRSEKRGAPRRGTLLPSESLAVSGYQGVIAHFLALGAILDPALAW